MAGFALALGFIFNWFFFEHTLGVAFPLYVALVIASLILLAHLHRVIWSSSAWMLAGLAMIFSSLVFIRASLFLTALNVLATLYLLLALTYNIFRPQFALYRLRDYVMPLLELPLSYFRAFFSALGELLSFRTQIRGHERTTQIAKGIFIVLPFLFIFIILFSSADQIFEKNLYRLIDINIAPELVPHILLIALVTSACLGAFWFIFKKAEPRFSDFSPPTFTLGTVESIVGLGALNVLFVLFILIQIKYLFGGTDAIINRGLTYADYARHGFFELIAVAIISLAVIWLAESFVAHRSRGFKVWSSIFIAQVFIIMISAFKRLALYEQAYGFTTLRLYSHLTIIFLGVVFLLLLYKLLIDRRDELFLRAVFLSAVTYLALVNIGNPDAFIARKNIELFASTGKIDRDYMTSLSDDALGELRNMPDLNVGRMKKEYRDWQSYHL